jgi:hypothetical protein
MRGLIEKILSAESVDVDDAVFPLVIRRAAGHRGTPSACSTSC